MTCLCCMDQTRGSPKRGPTKVDPKMDWRRSGEATTDTEKHSIYSTKWKELYLSWAKKGEEGGP